MVLIICWAPQHIQSVMPTTARPTGDFLKWCRDTYHPTRDTDSLFANLSFAPQTATALRTTWVHDWVEKEWLEDEEDPNYNRSLDVPGGVLKDLTLQQLLAQPARGVKVVLSKLHDALAPPLQEASEASVPSNNKWQVFSGEFTWAKLFSGVQLNICMCFNKAAVLKQKYMYLGQDGYLSVLVGYDANKKPIQEYAHRLVCLAYKGGPKLEGVGPFADWDWSLVVNHKCSNPSCLNPNHFCADLHSCHL